MDELPTDSQVVRRFEVTTGVDVIVGGEACYALARRVIENRDTLSAQAVGLLTAFMRDTGEFEMSSVEVFAGRTVAGGDFSLRYSFTADRDPHEYNYTYFEVYFGCHAPPQPPFWPFKFTVGFH